VHLQKEFFHGAMVKVGTGLMRLSVKPPLTRNSRLLGAKPLSVIVSS
jgi:hypothetical protein